MNKKYFFVTSIIVTILSVGLGVTLFYKSFLRLIETLGDLWSSLRYYVCELFEVEHTIQPGVIADSGILEWTELFPENFEEFKLKATIFFKMILNGNNAKIYGANVGDILGKTAQYIVIFLPLILLLSI